MLFPFPQKSVGLRNCNISPPTSSLSFLPYALDLSISENVQLNLLLGIPLSSHLYLPQLSASLRLAGNCTSPPTLPFILLPSLHQISALSLSPYFRYVSPLDHQSPDVHPSLAIPLTYPLLPMDSDPITALVAQTQCRPHQHRILKLNAGKK